MASRLLGSTPLLSSPAHWSDLAASSHRCLLRSGWSCQSDSVVRLILSILLSPHPITDTGDLALIVRLIMNHSLSLPAAVLQLGLNIKYSQQECNSGAPP